MKTLLAFLVLVAGCGGFGGAKMDPCSIHGQWRCVDNTAQLCSEDGWYSSDNCNEVHLMDGGVDEWECCLVDSEASCWEECPR